MNFCLTQTRLKSCSLAPLLSSNRLSQWTGRNCSWFISTCHNWLPVAQRITFKLYVITYNVKKKSMPSYLHNLLNDRSTSSSMSLRSSSQPLHYIRRCRTNCGRRAFSVAAAEHWNKLPIDNQNPISRSSIFRKCLRTFLFETAFNGNISILTIEPKHLCFLTVFTVLYKYELNWI